MNYHRIRPLIANDKNNVFFVSILIEHFSYELFNIFFFLNTISLEN